MSLPSIQEKLDGLDPGGTLAMERGDYGPCVINKPVILICDGATFWTDGNVPAVKVQSSGVVIKDAKMRGLDTASHVVISAAKDSHPLLQNIHIFGKAVGVEPEPAEWIVPEGIHTGEIPANHAGFFVDLAVPQRSQIVCRISGVSMDPSALSPGINTVKLRISDALPDSILIGEIEIIGSALTRLIPFFARISASPPPKSSSEASRLIVIPDSERTRFQKMLAGNAPAGSQPSSTQKSSAASQTGKQKTQPVPAAEPPRKQPARVSKPTDKTQAKAEKRKSAPAPQADPMKLGGAFGSGTTKTHSRYRRLPIYILADCSSKMAGDPIKAVETFIGTLHTEMMAHPSAVESAWVSVIAFDSNARQVAPLTGISDFVAPKLSTAKGSSLGAALEMLAEAIHREVDISDPSSGQKGDRKPLIFILTDGSPTDEWKKQVQKFKSTVETLIITVACGDTADTSVLKSISDIVLEMNNLSPGDLGMFFDWVEMPIAVPCPFLLPNPISISLDESATDLDIGRHDPIASTPISAQEKIKLGGAFSAKEHPDARDIVASQTPAVQSEKPTGKLDPAGKTADDKDGGNGAKTTAPLSKLFTDPRD